MGLIRILLILVFSLAGHLVYASDADESLSTAKLRCAQDYKKSPELYTNDFSWGLSLFDLEAKFNEIYASGKRLSLHATYDPRAEHFFLNLDHVVGQVRRVPIGLNFIKAITQQIEEALRAGFAEYVVFPDMGHAHLAFSEAHWVEAYQNDHMKMKQEELYARMLNDPQLHPLYHTAEQLHMKQDGKLIEDPHIKFRYWHRNVLGHNDGTEPLDIYVNTEAKFNTVSELAGFHIYSAGFNMSASKDGCFPYRTPKGETFFYDISLNGLQLAPGSDTGDY